jgi:hypothetical protein
MGRISGSPPEFKTGDDDKKIFDITESIGFLEKVLDSGFLNDCRNPVVLIGTDGANPFVRERVTTYSLWPLVGVYLNEHRGSDLTNVLGL